ncbi:MAG TPA: hypothetical protein DD414_12525 [Lachnospiraceae bacterium]|nr:hypothetical protein [Lachnospiraceae bacterium]
MAKKEIKSKTKCDIVVEEILGMIIQGEYVEGEKLPPEQYFVETFGVSRVTIREAFKRLNMLGVVSICQGKGTFVKKVDLGLVMQPLFSAIVVDNLSIEQLYDARLYVESGTACLAARNAQEEEMLELEELVKNMERVVAKKDTVHFSELDIILHKTIARISRNHIMQATYQTLEDVIGKYIVRNNLSMKIVEDSHESHIKICRAIRERDEKAAREKMETHIELTKRNLIAYYKDKDL